MTKNLVLRQKSSVLALQEECKSFSAVAQDLQNFVHTFKLLCFVDKSEDTIDLFGNERS